MQSAQIVLARQVMRMPPDLVIPAWSEAIVSLRRRLGLSQYDFGVRLHYSAMAVSRWETGKQEPISRCYIQLGNLADQPDCWMFWARAGIDESELRRMYSSICVDLRVTTTSDFEIILARSGIKKTRSKEIPKVQIVAIPILQMQVGTIGQTSCEFTDFASATVEQMIAAPKSLCSNPETTNCLRVKGTSMSPLINNGDVVAVDSSQTSLEELNRKIIVGWHRQNGIFLGRLIVTEGVHLLESENRDYNPINMEKDKMCQIVGKVLWWIQMAP